LLVFGGLLGGLGPVKLLRAKVSGPSNPGTLSFQSRSDDTPSAATLRGPAGLHSPRGPPPLTVLRHISEAEVGVAPHRAPRRLELPCHDLRSRGGGLVMKGFQFCLGGADWGMGSGLLGLHTWARAGPGHNGAACPNPPTTQTPINHPTPKARGAAAAPISTSGHLSRATEARKGDEKVTERGQTG
jgi:hypothetical protein